MPAIDYPNIEVRADGMAYVLDTPTKVVEIVLDRLAYHWDADEIRRQHPHLTLSQIYSALAFYYDHKSDLDEQIAQRMENEKQLIAGIGTSNLRRRLKNLKVKRRPA